MRKFFYLFISFLSLNLLCIGDVFSQDSKASLPTVGSPSVSDKETIPASGLNFGIISMPAQTPALGSMMASPAPLVDEVKSDDNGLKAKKKSQPELKEEKTQWGAEKKNKKRKKGKKNKKKRALERESEKAMEKALQEQVKVLRKERLAKMPYLDRVYVQTQITPFKIQQKENFLQGGSKNLSDLLTRAGTVHTKARADYENIALYNRRVLQSFRKLFPEVSFNFNERSGQVAATGRTEPYTGKDWHITLRQPLFNGGVLWNTFLQEKSNLEAARKQYDKTMDELVYDLSRAYFEYQYTLQAAEEHKAGVEKVKRFADMSEEKFRQKLISEIEHLNVQSLYSQMQFDLESANQELEIAKLDLQRYLDLSVSDEIAVTKTYDLETELQSPALEGQGPSDIATMLPTIFRQDEKAPELSKMIDLSYGHRPELRVEAAKLQATRLGEKIRWGEFLPKAYLTYEVGALGEAPQDEYNRWNLDSFTKDEPDLKKDWRLMLEIDWNLGGNKINYTYEKDDKAPALTQYQGTQRTNARKNGFTVGVLDGLDAFVNVKQAEVDKLNQVVELEKAEKQVLQDVKQAYYDYQKAVIQAHSTLKRLEYRKRLCDFAGHRLGKAEIEISEYLQAESDLVREKGEIHKALKDYFVAKASLNHAVGLRDFWNLEHPAEK